MHNQIKKERFLHTFMKKIFKLSSTFLLALSGVAISMSSGIYRFAITMGYFSKKYKNVPPNYAFCVITNDVV